MMDKPSPNPALIIQPDPSYRTLDERRALRADFESAKLARAVPVLTPFLAALKEGEGKP